MGDNFVSVSNNVPPQSRFPIVNLESGTKYELRVTAYNNAGSTQAEYLFTTSSPTGSNRIHDEHPPETEETSLFFDAHVLAPSVISLLAVFLAVAGVCFCLKTRKSRPTSEKQSYGPQPAEFLIPRAIFAILMFVRRRYIVR